MDGHEIELVRHAPPPALNGVVAGMVGMHERTAGLLRRRQPAGSLIPLIISFGDPLTVESLSDAAGAGSSYRSFVAGFSPGHATTSFVGSQECVQVYLHPIGVGRLLGAPAHEVARRVVAADEVLPRVAGLAERLASTPAWAERLSLVEAELLGQLEGTGNRVPRWVEWMWQRIVATGGQVRIGSLVEETGWSHRHVTRTFTEHVGLSPKQAADVVRFEHALADLGELPPAEVAARHGYADQSHLTRAVARHAGETPSRLAAARRPTALTALGLTPPQAGHGLG